MSPLDRANKYLAYRERMILKGQRPITYEAFKKKQLIKA